MLKIGIEAYWTQKAGNEIRHYEDSFWFSDETMNPFRAIVVDGSTVGVFSKEWAQDLSLGYAFASLWWSTDPKKRWVKFLDWLTPRQKNWLANVKPRARRPESLKKGTYATIVALTIDCELQQYQSIAIGDANLFHIRPGKFVQTWPIDKLTGFGFHPDLIGSVASENVGMMRSLKIKQGSILSGDCFILASDALAELIVKDLEKGITTTELLTRFSFQDNQHFLNFITEKRENNFIKNDDCTLIIVKVKEE